MKKFFSLIAAVLFAGSMFAAEVTVSKTVEELVTAYSWENGTVVTPFALDEVITVSTEATDANTGKYYIGGQQVRLYQTGAAKLIVTAAEGYSISSITLTYVSYNTGILLEAESGVAVNFDNVKSATFTVGNSGTATNGQVRLTAFSVTYNGEVPPTPADTYTVAGSDAAIFGESWNPALEANDMKLTNGIYKWEKAELNLAVGSIEFKVAKNHSWDIAYPAQNYVVNIAEAGEYTLTITFDPATEAVAAEAVKKEPLADPTNCAEAAAAALTVSKNNELYNDGKVYTIEGYVTEIATVWSEQYKNISFWMADTKDGGKVLEAYRAACASEEDAPAVGDKVAVTGTLTKYNTTPEFSAGCTFVITEKPTPTPSVNYYVAGSMNNWGPAEAYMLTPNNEKLYQGEFTFAANDEFKVIGVEGETTTWFPDGMGNNFKITEAGDYKITFNPEGNVEGWYAGYFNVVKKEIPQYEVAEAIAAGLNEGDEVLVRGVISKMQIKGKNFAKYGSVNIYVTDATGAEGEFEFFNCFSFNADTFRTTTPAYDAEGTTWDDLKKVADENGNEFRLGDTIVAFGKYKLYNTTHELTACYITDLKPAPVEPGQTIEVNMSEGLRFVDNVAAEGWWELYGADDKYVIELSNVSTEQIAGTYTYEDLDPDYLYIGIINGADTTYVTFVDGAITLAVSENGDVTVTGTLVGDDDNSYVLNLAYIVPTPQETVNVIIPDGELYDEMAEYGLYAIFGMDETVYVQLAIWVEGALQGDFTEADLDVQYIGSFIYDGEEYVEIYSAAITVTPGNGGDYNIVATILGYNNKQYTITMTIPAQQEGIEETLAAGKAAKVLRDGQVLILKGDKTFNVMGARIR